MGSSSDVSDSVPRTGPEAFQLAKLLLGLAHDYAI
jgi:hypothetical protein